MKPYILAIFILITLCLRAQDTYQQDSVEYRFGGGKSMLIVAADYQEIKEWGSVDSLYALFIHDFSKIEKNINPNAANHLRYWLDGPYRKIQIISDAAVESEVYVDQQHEIVYVQEVEFRKGKDEKIIFQATSISELKSIADFPLDSLLTGSDSLVAGSNYQRRNHISKILMVKGDRPVVDSVLSFSKATDQIELTYRIGIGTLYDFIVPDFEIILLTGFAKKGKLKDQFGLSYELKYLFYRKEDGRLGENVDGYANLLYLNRKSKNMRLTDNSVTDSERTLGIKGGLLIQNSSKELSDYSFKLSMLYGYGKNMMFESGLLFDTKQGVNFPFVRVALDF